MPTRVECYAGYRGEEEPRAFYLGERRVEVIEIADRWAEPGRRWFRCVTADGDAYVLRHDEAGGQWEIVAFTAASRLKPR